MWTIDTSFADAEPAVYWTSQPRPVPDQPPLDGPVEADLLIIGGGFTGLWAAVEAKRRNPDRDVVLLEMERIAFGASGRNGGFIDPSLTHGLSNGLARYPEAEVRTLLRLGDESYDQIMATIREFAIDCDFHRNGTVWAATEPYQLHGLTDAVAHYNAFGLEAEVLHQEELRELVHSPFYLGGLRTPNEGGLVDPARLAWGLLRAAIELGVRVHEQTQVVRLEDQGTRMVVHTDRGRVAARRVIHGTSAYPGVIPAIRRYVAPVYDYVLMTEPLTEEQHRSIGWQTRFGLSDGENQFVYHRMTSDRRILYGGWDAVYQKNGRVSPAFDTRDASHQFLARRFFRTFPQLEGLRFSHRWGGAIDTCSRFAVFFDTLHGGKVAYAAGYTGLGVGASRFGATTALDLVDGIDSEATRLSLVQKRPLPFPPEPLRGPTIQTVQWLMHRADQNEGRRSLPLRALDKLGLGFDS